MSRADSAGPIELTQTVKACHPKQEPMCEISKVVVEAFIL